jgi:hypothetical protein
MFAPYGPREAPVRVAAMSAITEEWPAPEGTDSICPVAIDLAVVTMTGVN